MRYTTNKWEKEGTVVDVLVCICEDCDFPLSLIGGTGCSHSNEWMYTYQCKKCKNVDMDERWMNNDSKEKELLNAGWKLQVSFV